MVQMSVECSGCPIMFSAGRFGHRGQELVQWCISCGKLPVSLQTFQTFDFPIESTNGVYVRT